VEFSVRAWRPVFESFGRLLGPRIFEHLYPDWAADQASAVDSTCRAEGSRVWVAEADGRPVGFVAVIIHDDTETGEIYMIAVDPDHQNKGTGSALVTFAVARIIERGMKLAEIGTGGDPGHAPARRVYEKAGFTPLPLVRYYKALPDISPLTPARLENAHELALEYLGQPAADALMADFAAHPELAIVLSIDSAVAGVAFGHPDGDVGVTLEGIAVVGPHAARGLGSMLLTRFEQAAANAGHSKVSLGSGPGYVEHFYLKNGYQQAEYMVVIPDGDRYSLDVSDLTVLRERHWPPNRLVLNIAAPQGYSPAVQAALRQRLGASEVCCIFSKPVRP
jgi:GNAT superfamily N-acetyltransferase